MTRYPFFMAAGRFAIHVMGTPHFEVRKSFARSGVADGFNVRRVAPAKAELAKHCLVDAFPEGETC
ncbi:hypothetical protein [Antarctobacter heliothermus]|uniref:hypothetical protein n=1 Tax=Antarctobacter heliothermus TaxID=74033 RepID=UPI000B8BD104|nr:hypothetical protein [Antarctobacter heliothermus]